MTIPHASMSRPHGSQLIDVRHLRALDAIGRHQRLATAARDLHCTPSALSHLLSDLERALGLPLVHRDRRPLQLAPAGLRLAACAARVLPAIQQAGDELERLRSGSSGRLFISLECHSCFEWLVPDLDEYRVRHPDVETDLRAGATFDPYPALRDGSVDVVISCDGGAQPGTQADALFRYEVVAVLPPRHPLAGKPALAPADFAAATVITYPVDESRLDLYTRFLGPAGISPQRRRTAELTAMVLQLVASGHGIAALPRWAAAGAEASGSVALRPLGSGVWSQLAVLRRSSDREAVAIDRFVAIARKVSFATLEGITAPRSAPAVRATARSALRRR